MTRAFLTKTSETLETAANMAIDRRSLLSVIPAVTLGALLGSKAALAAAPSSEDARSLIQTVGTQVLDILKQDIGQQDKFDQLVSLLDGSIDLDLVARLILARHWRTADEAQQAEYLKLFRAYALDSLASKLHIYNGQEFEITESKPAGKKDAVVRTLIYSPDRPPLHVDWRIRESSERGLIAIDVIVESVSLIVTQRSEFGAVVERSGIEGLLKELRRRIGSA